jgi:hypothetical protein
MDEGFIGLNRLAQNRSVWRNSIDVGQLNFARIGCSRGMKKII